MLVLFSVVCLNQFTEDSQQLYLGGQIPQRQLLQNLLKDISLTAKLGELTEYRNLPSSPVYSGALCSLRALEQKQIRDLLQRANLPCWGGAVMSCTERQKHLED